MTIINNKVRGIGKSYIKFVFLVFFIMLITNVAGVKTIPVSAGNLDINTWSIESVKQNAAHTFVWDVADSNGLLMYNNQTNCSFFLIQAGTTNQIASGIANRTPDDYGWYKTIPKNILSNIGQYDYQIDCFMISNNSVSGNLLNSFDVTPAGNTQDNQAFFILVVILIYAIALIGFFGKNEWITIIGGMAMIPLGLYMINNGLMIFRNSITDVLAWTTIGLGAFLSIFTALSLIKEELG